MDFYDVVFPLNIGPLTYRCPEALSDSVKPGAFVSAHLKNSITKGIVLRKASIKHMGTVKDIVDVNTAVPAISSSMIRLLQWMSDYYIAEQGLVLKNMLSKELFSTESSKTRRRKTPRRRVIQTSEGLFNSVAVDGELTSQVTASIGDSTYRTFLLHATSSGYAHSFLVQTLTDTRNCIILVPEISSLTALYDILHERFGQRICLFHGELSAGERREAFEQIRLAQADIVLGTRSAVFAPLKKISFIAVLEEHSASYKQEKHPSYNGRDVAVMRGFFEKATVLLSSVSPSVESYHNCKSGKYTLLKPASPVKIPRFRILNMRYEKHVKPYLSKTVVDTAEKHLQRDGKIMFVVHRRGYSTLLACPDCNHVEKCPTCKIPLVYHKQGMSLRCHYCGHTRSTVPESCGKCRGHNLQLLGAGTQRVQEDIESILKIRSARFDSDRIKKTASMREQAGGALTDEYRIVVGTKLMTRRLNHSVTFSMAAILNTDSLLNLPDFRSAEKAFQEIASVADRIEPGGEMLIQTRMPQHYLFKAVKNGDYELFFREELSRRKPLLYPPFARLILVRCTSKREWSNAFLEEISKPHADVGMLGPSVSKNKKGYEYKLLLKSPDRSALHAAATSLRKMLEGSQDVRVKIDVDPTVI